MPHLVLGSSKSLFVMPSNPSRSNTSKPTSNYTHEPPNHEMMLFD